MSPKSRMWMRAALLLPALILAAMMLNRQTPTASPPPKFSPTALAVRLDLEDGGSFAVLGLDPIVALQLANATIPTAAWNAFFSVTANQSPEPMLGTYSMESGELRFRPRWPLLPDVKYVARLTPLSQPIVPSLASPSTTTFSIPKPLPPPPAVLTAIYPSSGRLPENLLRMYLHFSAPMRRGDVYDFIHILDAGGKPVPSPFVTLGEELWNEDGTRLTLLFDPGRQKHDLLPRQQAGPVLESGKSYTLVIDAAWPDVHGRPLGRETRKRFEAIQPETRPIQPEDWKITGPKPNSRDPLTIEFDRCLDHALLRRVVGVVNASGKVVDGEIKVSDSETRWQLTPRETWAAGDYEVVIEAILEDVTGNRVGRAFEVDEDRPDPGPKGAVRRRFTIDPVK